MSEERLSRLQKWILSKVLKAGEEGFFQGNVLEYYLDEPGFSYAIARDEDDNKKRRIAISRSVGNLYDRGLIELYWTKGDIPSLREEPVIRRVHVIKLTPEGKRRASLIVNRRELTIRDEGETCKSKEKNRLAAGQCFEDKNG